MKKLSSILLLSAVATLLGCSTADDMPPSESSVDGVWDTSSMASMLDMELEGVEDLDDFFNQATRAIYIGGTAGTSFMKLWDSSDKVQVYKDGVNVGTLTPNNKGSQRSTLSGTLTGSFAVGDELTLYMPSANLDYTGQDGTIANMCKYFDYMTTTTTVSSISGTKITTQELAFSSRQGYLLLKFRDENNKLLHVKQLILHAPSGLLVATRSIDGTTTYTNQLVILPPKESSSVDDYPFDIYIAVLNENTAKEAYTFTVTATDGKTYVSKAAMNGKLNLGKMASARHAVYCTEVDVEAQTAITPPESDEPDVQQVTL